MKCLHVFCLVSISDNPIHLNHKINRTQTNHIKNQTVPFNSSESYIMLPIPAYTLPLKFKVCVSFHSQFLHVFFHSTWEAFAAYNLGVLSLNSSNNSEESTCSIETYLGWRFVWDFVGWFWFNGFGDCESIQILFEAVICFLWIWDVLLET